MYVAIYKCSLLVGLLFGVMIISFLAQLLTVPESSRKDIYMHTYIYRGILLFVVDIICSCN